MVRCDNYSRPRASPPSRYSLTGASHGGQTAVPDGQSVILTSGHLFIHVQAAAEYISLLCSLLFSSLTHVENIIAPSRIDSL